MWRLSGVVVGMGIAAALVALLAFGPLTLVISLPALLGTVLLLLVVRLSEAPRRRLRDHRLARVDPAASVPGGLMSGFFEVPPLGVPPFDVAAPEIPTQAGPVSIPQPARAGTATAARVDVAT